MRLKISRLVSIAAGCASVFAACSGGAGGGRGESPVSVSPMTAPATNGTEPVLDRSTSLIGPDANGDGVRDDIAHWIAQQPASALQKGALMQLAKAIQGDLLVDVTDQAAVLAVSAQEHAAVKCTARRHVDQAIGAHAVSVIEKMTANTRERTLAYLRYAKALNGTVSQSPEGDGCAQ